MQQQWSVLLMGILLMMRGAISSPVPANASGITAGTTSGTTDAGASLEGQIKFEGTFPKNQPIAMRSDPACAAEHPHPIPAQDVVAGNDGALENVIVFVVDGLGDKSFDVPASPAVMEQKGCMYGPHVLAMRAGQVLRVVNDDKTTHNIHPMPSNNREWNKAQMPGQPIEEKFPREEIAIPVKCNIHPWMHSYIAVFKHPFFAVTGKDGSFSLPNLPPGDYTIEAWHEKLGTLTQHIKVGKGENKKVEFTFKSKA